jgi:hypothetical protein
MSYAAAAGKAVGLNPTTGAVQARGGLPLREQEREPRCSPPANAHAHPRHLVAPCPEHPTMPPRSKGVLRRNVRMRPQLAPPALGHPAQPGDALDSCRENPKGLPPTPSRENPLPPPQGHPLPHQSGTPCLQCGVPRPPPASARPAAWAAAARRGGAPQRRAGLRAARRPRASAPAGGPRARRRARARE